MKHIDKLKSYKIGRTLGEGAFGKVKYAKHIETGEEVAIKIIAKKKIRKPESLKREIALLTKLDHPNIIKLLHVFENQDGFFLVLEYAPRGELFDFLVSKGRISERHASALMLECLQAMKHCHDLRIIHRDIKPENLLLGRNYELKITDFGLSKQSSDESDLLTTQCGSPSYAAPEVLCNKPYTNAVDMWSIGVVFYALVIGHLPFPQVENLAVQQKNIRTGDFQVPHYISDPLKDLLHKLIEIDPEKRITADQALKHPWFETASLTPLVVTPSLKEFWDDVGISIDKARELSAQVMENIQGCSGPDHIDSTTTTAAGDRRLTVKEKEKSDPADVAGRAKEHKTSIATSSRSGEDGLVVVGQSSDSSSMEDMAVLEDAEPDSPEPRPLQISLFPKDGDDGYMPRKNYRPEELRPQCKDTGDCDEESSTHSASTCQPCRRRAQAQRQRAASMGMEYEREERRLHDVIESRHRHLDRDCESSTRSSPSQGPHLIQLDGKPGPSAAHRKSTPNEREEEDDDDGLSPISGGLTTMSMADHNRQRHSNDNADFTVDHHGGHNEVTGDESRLEQSRPAGATSVHSEPTPCPATTQERAVLRNAARLAPIDEEADPSMPSDDDDDIDSILSDVDHSIELGYMRASEMHERCVVDNMVSRASYDADFDLRDTASPICSRSPSPIPMPNDDDGHTTVIDKHRKGHGGNQVSMSSDSPAGVGSGSAGSMSYVIKGASTCTIVNDPPPAPKQECTPGFPRTNSGRLILTRSTADLLQPEEPYIIASRSLSKLHNLHPDYIRMSPTRGHGDSDQRAVVTPLNTVHGLSGPADVHDIDSPVSPARPNARSHHGQRMSKSDLDLSGGSSTGMCGGGGFLFSSPSSPLSVTSPRRGNGNHDANPTNTRQRTIATLPPAPPRRLHRQRQRQALLSSRSSQGIPASSSHMHGPDAHDPKAESSPRPPHSSNHEAANVPGASSPGGPLAASVSSPRAFDMTPSADIPRPPLKASSSLVRMSRPSSLSRASDQDAASFSAQLSSPIPELSSGFNISHRRLEPIHPIAVSEASAPDDAKSSNNSGNRVRPSSCTTIMPVRASPSPSPKPVVLRRRPDSILVPTPPPIRTDGSPSSSHRHIATPPSSAKGSGSGALAMSMSSVDPGPKIGSPRPQASHGSPTATRRSHRHRHTAPLSAGSDSSATGSQAGPGPSRSVALVATATTTSPYEIKEAIKNALEVLGCTYKRIHRSLVKGTLRDIKFELELTRVPGLSGVTKVVVKRVMGDTIAFQSHVTEVLRRELQTLR